MWGISGVACEGMSRGSRGGGQDSILTNSCIELVLNFSFVGIVGAGRGAARIVLWDLLTGGGGGGSFSVYIVNRFVWPFPDGPSGCGGGPVRCPKLRAGRGVRASLTEVDPAGKLQWHFTCGFDFRHSLWLPFEAAFAIPKGLNICILNLRQWIDLFLNCDHFIIAYHIA